jgi:hypothetical protein
LQPCFYESPVENGFAMNQPTVPDADAFVDQQIAFYDELLGGRYGHIERLWWDHYPGGCGGLSACPNNSFPQGYERIIEHIRKVSPTTLISNGPDVQWVGNTKGTGTYPVWNYCDLDPKTPTTPNCKSFGPRGQRWMPRMEGYTIQKGGNWFWHEGEVGLTAAQIWTHWKQAVGRGTHLLLNVPPNSTGLIPDAYREQLNTFGSALRETMSSPTWSPGNTDVVGMVAQEGNVTVACSSDQATNYAVLGVRPDLAAGATVDMVQLREQVAGENGRQVIGEFHLDVQVAGKAWQPVKGIEIHGQTVGHRVVSLFDEAVENCTAVRFSWTCPTAASQSQGRQQQGIADADAEVEVVTALLASFSLHRRPPLFRTYHRDRRRHCRLKQAKRSRNGRWAIALSPHPPHDQPRDHPGR